MIDLDAVGRVLPPYETRWTSTDAILYALGVGAGVNDLDYTTENSHGRPQRVLPSFGLVIAVGARALDAVGSFDRTKLVHARQRLQLNRPIPTAGHALVRESIRAVLDNGPGKHAVVTTRAEVVDPAEGPLLTSEMTVVLRGLGGFGGPTSPRAERVQTPDGPPDMQVTLGTTIDQALLYRLSGDRNPLHSDPWFAAQAGFAMPILHGLCTLGVATRALLGSVCEGDPQGIAELDASFTAPVLPGQQLTTNVWRRPDGAWFTVTASPDDRLVIDGGLLRTR